MKRLLQLSRLSEIVMTVIRDAHGVRQKQVIIISDQCPVIPLIPTLAGYSCDMVNKTMSFAPVINEKDYTTFWINGKGWGTYHQTIDDKGEVKKEVTVLYGNIDDVKVE